MKRFVAFHFLVFLLFQLGPSSVECQRSRTNDIPTVELTWDWFWNPEIENPEEWQIFDQPSHMIMGIHDDLFICDQVACHVVRIRKDGSYIETIGREGGGPGEFRRPSYMAIHNESSTLLITDYSSGRISLFRIHESSSEFIESYLSTFLSRLRVPSLIMEDDQSVWTIGYEDKSRIYKVALDNSILIKFGEPWIIEDLPPMNVGLLNRGLLFDPENGMIGYVWRTRPLVELWSKDGNLQSEMPLTFSEISLVDDYFKDNDRSGLGTNWVPLYFSWTHTLTSSDALYIGFASGQKPFVFFELSLSTLAPRRRYSCSDTPEYYRIVSCVAEDTDEGMRFYAFDALNHGIVIFDTSK